MVETDEEDNDMVNEEARFGTLDTKKLGLSVPSSKPKACKYFQ